MRRTTIKMTKLTFGLFVSIIIIVTLLMSASPILAQTIPDYTGGVKSFGAFIENVSSYLLGLAAPLAVLISLWAAFILMTAAGDPKRITAGHQTLMWAVIGLAVIILSRAMLQITQTTVAAGAPEAIIQKLIGYARNIGGPIAIVMFLYGGLLLSTSQPEKIKTAYKIFLWTSVAIAIIALASSIEAIVLFFFK